jgi:hypothetical protein
LVVIAFVGEWSKQSLKFRQEFNASLPLFGQFDNVAYLAASVERCPDAFRAFDVNFVPTVVFTDSFGNVIKRFETDDVARVMDALTEES